MVYRVNSLTFGATMPINERMSLRLFDNYERGRISDWHWPGFDSGLVVGNRVYTDGGPQSYNANLIGLLFNIWLSPDGALAATRRDLSRAQQWT